MNANIPRIVHQTWKNATLPHDYARYRQTVLEHHPGWEHRLWTDTDNRLMIERHYPWFLTTYDGYKHNIERADAVRYFILLQHGGVYIDLDMECLKPIDPLLDEGGPHFSLLASPTIDHTIIANALMAAPKGHPFFAYLTKRLPHLIERDVTFADVFNNTGPDMLARHVRLFEHVWRFNIIGLDKVCDRSILDQNPALAGRDIDAVRAERLLYFIHHHTNSWNIQHPAPDVPIDGFELIEDHDLHGFDIDYVEYPAGAYDQIAAAARDNPDVVAFNYNGFLKGYGGHLVPCRQDNHWIKTGIRPWVCIKRECLEELAGNLPSPQDH
jgi:hypothetical protein